MALSTTFSQCAPDTTKFGKITQNKGHFAIFAVQFHSRSPIFVPIESYDFLSKRQLGQYCALSLEFINLLGIYTVGVARSLGRRLLLDIVIVNCP